MESLLAQLASVLMYVIYLILSQYTPLPTDTTLLLSPTPVVLGDQLTPSIVQTTVAIPEDASSAIVKNVIDGDTIEVIFNNEVDTIRLIGIDSPELKAPRKQVECFGVEASTFAKQYLNGKKIYLTRDSSQGNSDKYGRLLRYVWLDEKTNLNQMMIANGYAYEYTYDTPYMYQTAFKESQQQAQAQKLGLWSETTCSGKKLK